MTAIVSRRPAEPPAGRCWRSTSTASRLEMGPERRKVTLGRDLEADFTVRSPLVSRAHAMIERRRERFVLVDHSLNGSFVTFEGRPEMKLRHEELTLVGHGWIAFGQPRADAQQVAEFHCLEPADGSAPYGPTGGPATSEADAAPAARPAPR
jgi:adenylate cyclase